MWKTLAALGWLLATLLGGVLFVSSQHSPPPFEVPDEEHWRVLAVSKGHAEPPPHWPDDVTVGPKDEAASRAALVARGRLDRIDLVLPTVPSTGDVQRRVLEWRQEHRDLVEHLAGFRTWTDFRPAGDAVAEFTVWLREYEPGPVQKLIAELESEHGRRPE